MAEIDPDIAQLLGEIEESPLPPFWRLSVSEARKMVHDGNKINNGPIPDGAVINTNEIPSPHGPIPIRLYRPESQPADTVVPVLLYFHGGGFVINRPEDLDVPCTLLCQAADCLIASVDYRLAPDHPFPQGLEDVWMALQWAQQNAGEWGADPQRLAVGGDSAGGNLAAVCAQLTRDQGGPDLALQLLFYPNTDLNGDYPSRHEFATGYNLEWEGMEWFINHYITDPKDLQNPKVSPIRAKDFSKLPPALVFTAGYDPLRDEGHAYVEKLKAAGIAVQHEYLASMIHGFLTMRSRSPKMIDRVMAISGTALKKAFGN